MEPRRPLEHGLLDALTTDGYCCTADSPYAITESETMARVPVVTDTPDLPDQYLKCRTWGHAWDTYAPLGMAPPEYGWRESLRCTRCTMERHSIIDRKDSVSSRSYYQPEGYARPKGSGKLTSQEKRKMMFERMREQLTQAAAISAEIGRSSRPKIVPIRAKSA